MTSDLQPGSYPAPTDDLASAEDSLRVLQQVVHSITPGDLSKQTPCPGFDVAGLTDHLLSVIATIGGAVGEKLPPRDQGVSIERQLLSAAQPAITAWQRHGLEGMVALGANEAPAAAAVGILSIEFLVHAWDYAVATGRAIDVPEPLAEYVLGIARKIITPHGRAAAGFAEPVAVPDDAGAIDRLLAFTGRNPAR
ncbi:MAG: TIGR03086 family metal-binding protein [Mycobacterium sp.]|uniref:TIGR03086 family metal-binding protein n=1 Tax=Mycobacterium sp. TaxID=1785 RepID=UPI0026324B1C|nr:TIGR03086 family metal-binding protein [Mycobacterium sp.]MDI3313304.1 TIGR03086 family metal-binding protein [Mycobacterium sp.]